jgi:hypothetical protein
MPTAAPVYASTLPPFSNARARCAKCGARYEIRAHFDRGCAQVVGGEHYHRICNCGNRWAERCSEGPRAPVVEGGPLP